MAGDADPPFKSSTLGEVFHGRVHIERPASPIVASPLMRPACRQRRFWLQDASSRCALLTGILTGCYRG